MIRYYKFRSESDGENRSIFGVAMDKSIVSRFMVHGVD